MKLISEFQVEKNVFVIFYSGERAKEKIRKICEAFGANRYPFTDDLGKQFQMITEVTAFVTVFYSLHNFFSLSTPTVWLVVLTVRI